QSGTPSRATLLVTALEGSISDIAGMSFRFHVTTYPKLSLQVHWGDANLPFNLLPRRTPIDNRLASSCRSDDGRRFARPRRSHDDPSRFFGRRDRNSSASSMATSDFAGIPKIVPKIANNYRQPFSFPYSFSKSGLDSPVYIAGRRYCACRKNRRSIRR